MVAIKTTGLVKRYRNVVAVDGLDLEIEKGEVLPAPQLGIEFHHGETRAVLREKCI